MTTTSPPATDPRYQEAMASIAHAIDKIEGCSAEEKRKLQEDLANLRGMEEKLNLGRVEIIIFGEISTGNPHSSTRWWDDTSPR